MRFCGLLDLGARLLALEARLTRGGTCGTATDFHVFDHAFSDHLCDRFNI